MRSGWHDYDYQSRSAPPPALAASTVFTTTADAAAVGRAVAINGGVATPGVAVSTVKLVSASHHYRPDAAVERASDEFPFIVVR